MAETCKALGGYEMMGESAPIARLCMTKSLCVSVREVAESVWCGRVSGVLVGTWCLWWRPAPAAPLPSRTVLELSCVFARACFVSVGHTW